MRLDIVIVCVNYDDYLQLTLPRNIRSLNGHAEIAIVTDNKDIQTQKIAHGHGLKLIISDRIHERGAPIAKGRAINDAFEVIKPADWILVMDADILLQRDLIGKICDMPLNRDSLYYTRRWGPETVAGIPRLLADFDSNKSIKEIFDCYANKEVAEITRRKGNAIECFAFGYFQLFNKNASSLKNRARIYEEKYQTAEMDDHMFGNFIFSTEKRCRLPEWDFDVIHLPHGHYTQNWAGRVSQRIPEA